MKDFYAVILAGGSGTRLWPRSRSNRPKPFLDLFGSQTLLQSTVNRLLPLIPLERICVAAGESHMDVIRDQVPALPEQNLLVEPFGRGTGPCIGLAAVHLRQRHRQATMVSLHSDHVIRDEAGFRQALETSYVVAQAGRLVTMGATPTHAETGYGYIERGGALTDAGSQPVYRIARFTEKPDAVTAAHMVESGRFYWNTGIFTWRIETILDAFARWMPQFGRQLVTIGAAVGTDAERVVLRQTWPSVSVESIDRGIMERADNSAVVPVAVGWSDIGSWSALYDLLPAADHGNVLHGDHVAIDTEGTLIHSGGRMIAAIGLRDMIIVESDDAVLVCPRERAQDVKAVVERLKEHGRDELV